MKADEVRKELAKYIQPEKAKASSKFFKTGKGEYGAGDVFIGVTVPNQRIVAKKFRDLPLDELKKLLLDRIHEYRLTALFILVHKYNTKNSDKAQLANFYLDNISGVDNWDLVDSSAHKILGPYLYDQDKKILYDFAHSKDIWKQRISMIATMYYINKREYHDALAIAEILLKNDHDLIHKAVGWMLREIGKKDQNI